MEKKKKKKARTKNTEAEKVLSGHAFIIGEREKTMPGG